VNRPLLAAQEQEPRKFTAEGFEFSTKTPTLRYHFPRKGVKGTVFTGTWFAETAAEISSNYEIDTAEVDTSKFDSTKDVAVIFSLSKPEKDWPQGLYRLEIRADGKLIQTIRFVIQ
jgi:hypothetical protein